MEIQLLSDLESLESTLCMLFRCIRPITRCYTLPKHASEEVHDFPSSLLIHAYPTKRYTSHTSFSLPTTVGPPKTPHPFHVFFWIEARTGELKLMNSILTGGTIACHVSLASASPTQQNDGEIFLIFVLNLGKKILLWFYGFFQLEGTSQKECIQDFIFRSFPIEHVVLRKGNHGQTHWEMDHECLKDLFCENSVWQKIVSRKHLRHRTQSHRWYRSGSTYEYVYYMCFMVFYFICCVYCFILVL